MTAENFNLVILFFYREGYKLLDLHPETSFPKSGCKLALSKLHLVQARKIEL